MLFGGSPLAAGPEALAVVAEEVPTADLPAAGELAAGVDVVPLLVEAGLASSKGDARRALEQGAVSVNGERVGPGASIDAGAVLHGRYVLLRRASAAMPCWWPPGPENLSGGGNRPAHRPVVPVVDGGPRLIACPRSPARPVTRASTPYRGVRARIFPETRRSG